MSYTTGSTHPCIVGHVRMEGGWRGDGEPHVEVFGSHSGRGVPLDRLAVGVVRQGRHDLDPPLDKLATVADVLGHVVVVEEPPELPRELQAVEGAAVR